VKRVAIAVAGGGTNVIGLYRALRVIRRRLAAANVKVAATVGTSAGGLAVLADANDTDEERTESQVEGACSRGRLVRGGPLSLAIKGGWATMDEFKRHAQLLMPGDPTLAQAKTPVGVVVGDLVTRRPRLLSSWTTPDARAWDCAAATAAIPLVFERQRVRGCGVDHDFVDGGVAKNLASDELDHLGVPVISIRPRADLADAHEPKGPLGRLLAVASLLHHASNHAWESDHPDSVVVDVPGGDGFDFDVDHAEASRRRRVADIAARAARLPWGIP
jgi:predicted acylesterase/phospholipase RssA